MKCSRERNLSSNTYNKVAFSPPKESKSPPLSSKDNHQEDNEISDKKIQSKPPKTIIGKQGKLPAQFNFNANKENFDKEKGCFVFFFF